MRSFRDMAAPKRQPTPNEEEAIKDVYDLAINFKDGLITLDEVRAATSGKQRFLATTFTPPDHAMFKPLMSMLDALIASAS